MTRSRDGGSAPEISPAVDGSHGEVADGFEAVRERFERNFDELGEGGGAVSVYLDGRRVVDVWGGDAAPGRPWERDTVVLAMSTGKGMVALVAQMLEDRGLVDIDAPVARYWPQFAAEGKAQVTIAMILTHRGGVPWWEGYERVCDLDRPASFQDAEGIAAGLAATAPVMEPGRLGYHSQTMGFVIGEVTRRVTGLSIGTFFAREIADPLGARFFIGLPAEGRAHAAVVSGDEGFDAADTHAAFNVGTAAGRSMLWGPRRRPGEVIRETFNDPAFLAAELAAAGPVGDARALARIYGALARGGELDGTRLVSPESIERFRTPQVRGTDACWLQEYNLAQGYLLGHMPRHSWGPHRESFGHHGLGGATAFADPVSRVGFGYVTNRFHAGADVDARAQALIDALYGCLS